MAKTLTARSKSTSRSQPARLEFTSTEAREVFVAGSSDDWQPTAAPLKSARDGKWRIELPLAPGRYGDKD